jgi:hypothetical protein
MMKKVLDTSLYELCLREDFALVFLLDVLEPPNIPIEPQYHYSGKRMSLSPLYFANVGHGVIRIMA